ncbi:MAG: hypothetical protein N2322_01700 [Terrimicrobiaceae bacterium]|nr:hypothetical protein [Terrimicrobiaceae bacterium]
MTQFLYLSLIPEALILSQLPPDKFGAYMATGAKRQIEGPAVFFELDPAADLPGFRIQEGRARCVAHPDGSPRCSTYLGVYGVLERVPVSTLKKAYLATPAGLTLGLDPSDAPPSHGEKYFLYQELGPVYPRVASTLEPAEFCRFVADPSSMVSVPRIAFIDLKLEAMSRDCEAPAELPYPHLGHIRECLRFLRDNPSRKTKIVNRGLRPDILFSMLRTGLYIGDAREVRAFLLPPEDEIERNHQLWWHSARAARGY